MSLRETFEAILLAGDATEWEREKYRLLLSIFGTVDKLCEAVCTYIGDHDWPLELYNPYPEDLDELPTKIITGPCKVCGAKEEEP